PEQLELVLVEGLLAGAGEEHAERAAAVEQWCGGDRRVAEEVPALGLDERLLRRVNGRAWSAVADHPAGEAPFDRERQAGHVGRQAVRRTQLERLAVLRQQLDARATRVQQAGGPVGHELERAVQLRRTGERVADLDERAGVREA